MTTRVVGIGSPHSGDDAIGLVVADLVRLAVPKEVEVLTTTAPARLLDLWDESDEVVVVDCVHADDPPGTVSVQRLDAAHLPVPGGSGGTHGFGLAEAVELSRVLHRLPRRVTFVGVEAGCLEPGASLSPGVVGAVPQAVRAVLDVLDLHRHARPWLLRGAGRPH